MTQSHHIHFHLMVWYLTDRLHTSSSQQLFLYPDWLALDIAIVIIDNTIHFNMVHLIANWAHDNKSYLVYNNKSSYKRSKRTTPHHSSFHLLTLLNVWDRFVNYLAWFGMESRDHVWQCVTLWCHSQLSSDWNHDKTWYSDLITLDIKLQLAGNCQSSANNIEAMIDIPVCPGIRSPQDWDHKKLWLLIQC